MKISVSSKYPKLICFSFFASLILLSGPFSFCRAQPISETAGSQQIHVTSDKMIAQKGNQMVEFVGNAVATRLDAVLKADSIKIFFQDSVQDKQGKKEEQNKKSENRIEKIISTGNVKYTENERTADADKAVYTTMDDILILTGKAPRLSTGTSFVTGKKITLYRQQDKVIVESDGSNQVEALFNPEDNPSGKTND